MYLTPESRNSSLTIALPIHFCMFLSHQKLNHSFTFFYLFPYYASISYVVIHVVYNNCILWAFPLHVFNKKVRKQRKLFLNFKIHVQRRDKISKEILESQNKHHQKFFIGLHFFIQAPHFLVITLKYLGLESLFIFAPWQLFFS